MVIETQRPWAWHVVELVSRYQMPRRPATKNAAGIAILNHITYGSMLRLKASADASSSVTRAPASRPPILDATQVAAAAVTPHMSPATASTQSG